MPLPSDALPVVALLAAVVLLAAAPVVVVEAEAGGFVAAAVGAIVAADALALPAVAAGFGVSVAVELPPQAASSAAAADVAAPMRKCRRDSAETRERGMRHDPFLIPGNLFSRVWRNTT